MTNLLEVEIVIRIKNMKGKKIMISTNMIKGIVKEEEIVMIMIGI